MPFARKVPILFVFFAVPVLAVGCSGKKAAEGDVQRRDSELSEVYEMFATFTKHNQRPPKQLSDLNSKEFQGIYPVGLKALRDGQYVAVWGVDVNGKDSGTVLAYEKDAPKQGGAVLMANGNVKTMSADDLQAILPKK